MGLSPQLEALWVKERDKLEQQVVAIRRHLHQYPEVSLDEFETTAYIKQRLTDLGISLRASGLPTGAFAEIGSAAKGPTVAIRADIDALPILEKADVPFRSLHEGVMHACGHDFHTAAVLGAAAFLKQAEEELPGRIRLIFQPAEEKSDGALQVIEDGQLEDVDAIIGIHNKPDLPVGTVGLKKDGLMAAVDRFYVTIKGKGSHGALPHKGNDPVVTAAQIVSSLQAIVSRKVSPLETAVLSVTRIDGGTTWNVIPEEVVMEGTMRAFLPEVRELLKQEFYEVVLHTAAAFGQTADIIWDAGPAPIMNDHRLLELIAEEAQKDFEVIEVEPSIAGEDFACYQEHVPSVFAFFGTDGREEWHHPRFTVNEDALILAVRYFVISAVAVLQKAANKQTADRQ